MESTIHLLYCWLFMLHFLSAVFLRVGFILCQIASAVDRLSTAVRPHSRNGSSLIASLLWSSDRNDRNKKMNH